MSKFAVDASKLPPSITGERGTVCCISLKLVMFNFLVNSYHHSVGTAGFRQQQSNWAISLFTNNSPPKYSCHSCILIDCSMPLNERKFIAASQGQRAIACAFSKSLSVDNCLQSMKFLWITLRTCHAFALSIISKKEKKKRRSGSQNQNKNQAIDQPLYYWGN